MVCRMGSGGPGVAGLAPAGPQQSPADLAADAIADLASDCLTECNLLPSGALRVHQARKGHSLSMGNFWHPPPMIRGSDPVPLLNRLERDGGGGHVWCVGGGRPPSQCTHDNHVCATCAPRVPDSSQIVIFAGL